MGRWQPNARGRLAEAAMALYVERGYEQTTVAEIAARAGLTERTFFRHFADKREVLFGGSQDLLDLLVRGVEAAPPEAAPLDAVAAGFAAVGEMFAGAGDYPHRRQGVIAANPVLQERELMKMAALAVALAATLGERGVAEPVATLTAETGVAVFKVAFERWVAVPDGPPLTAVLEECFAALRGVTTPA